GGLEVWGAPISLPRRGPANVGFIYQRFQRGIMHYCAGVGTDSILLADYLKALGMGKEVPPDQAAQAAGSRIVSQYCPGALAWLCRPCDLPGTDLMFAFERG